MSRWASLALIVGLPLVLVVSQLLLYLLAGALEGADDVFSPTLTPLRLLAANLSTGLTALVALMLLARLARAPWRDVFSWPRRWDWRRLLTYAAVSLPLAGSAFVVSAVLAPGSAGWVGLEVTGTTIAFLAVVALSTPMQAAGEEVVFRGALIPAVASWSRAVRPALALGLVVPGLLFALLHGTTDPWFVAYYVAFSVTTGLMGVLSRGLEAAVGFHVANNLVTTTVNVLLAGGGSYGVDRSAGAGSPALLVVAAGAVAVLGVVARCERRARATSVSRLG